MYREFMHIAAIIDVYSRKILNWSISNSMRAECCQKLLEDTIDMVGKPEIHNSDKGSEYTSQCYINMLTHINKNTYLYASPKPSVEECFRLT